MRMISRQRRLALPIICVLAAFCAGAQTSWEIVPPECYLAAEKVIEVKVTGFEHSLAGTKPRRPAVDEFIPAMPYSIVLVSTGAVLNDKPVKMTLDGLTSAPWMPKDGQKALMLVRREQFSLVPTCPFPEEGFFPITDDGRVEFPPYAGQFLPVDAVRGMIEMILPDGREGAENGVTRLVAGLDPGTTAEKSALLYLLQTVRPVSESAAIAALKQITEGYQVASAGDGQARNEYLVLTQYAVPLLSPEGLGAFYGLAKSDIMTVSPVFPPRKILPVLAKAVACAGEGKKGEMLVFLFGMHEVDGADGKTEIRRYVSSLREVREWIAPLNDPETTEFLRQMAVNPKKWAGIASFDDMSALWELLLARDSAFLADHLQGIASQKNMPDLPFTSAASQLEILRVNATNFLKENPVAPSE